MSASVFIARLIGPVMLVIGLAVFVNQRAFRDMAEEFLASRALLFLSGLLIMPVGLAIVLTHNIWAADGRVMITVFGWLSLLGGAVRLFAPAYVTQTGRTMLKQPRFVTIAAATWVVAGTLFCLFGFLH
ncbi:MAG: hypothetical protein ACJ8EF_10915 [Bradyrhizobium sp.]|jgi:hypothetical protein